MASAAQIARSQARDLRYRMAREEKQILADQFREGIYKAYRKAIEDAIATGNKLAEVTAKSEDSYREALFRRIGELAQRSMLASYDQLVTRQEGPASHSHYRQGQGRLAGGVLRRALASKAFFTATTDGIEWGDVDFLDRAAAHWHRINFGAAPAGEGTSVEYPVNFGSSATSIGYEEGPSPGFSMPAGLWLNGAGNVVRPGSSARGADQFWPMHFQQGGAGVLSTPINELRGTIRRSKIRSTPVDLRNTQGIEGKNFLNAGIRRLAEEIPKAFKEYTDDLVNGAIRDVSTNRHRSEIIQGPTRHISKPRQGLTQGGEGDNGFQVELP